MGETVLVGIIERYINGFVKNAFVWRNNTGAMKGAYTTKAGITKKRFTKFAKKGSADIIGVYKGRFLAIEVKFGDNDQQPSQIAFQQDVERCGGIYILAYSLQDVMDAIIKIP